MEQQYELRINITPILDGINWVLDYVRAFGYILWNEPERWVPLLSLLLFAAAITLAVSMWRKPQTDRRWFWQRRPNAYEKGALASGENMMSRRQRRKYVNELASDGFMDVIFALEMQGKITRDESERLMMRLAKNAGFPDHYRRRRFPWQPPYSEDVVKRIRAYRLVKQENPELAAPVNIPGDKPPRPQPIAHLARQAKKVVQGVKHKILSRPKTKPA